jgi:hypothetical protein
MSRVVYPHTAKKNVYGMAHEDKKIGRARFLDALWNVLNLLGTIL